MQLNLVSMYKTLHSTPNTSDSYEVLLGDTGVKATPLLEVEKLRHKITDKRPLAILPQNIPQRGGAC